MKRGRDELNEIQQKLLEFLRKYQAKCGFPATRIECARAIERSQGSVDYHLREMAMRKWIEIEHGAQRGIKLLREGTAIMDAETGDGLDETDPDRPRINSIEALLRGKPDLFVRAGNDAMAGAGIGRGDCVALAVDRTPEDGDTVGAKIDGTIEVRRFVHTQTGDMLATKPEKWTGEEVMWTRADGDNVTILGVEIASVTMPEGKKRREREMARALKRKSRTMEW